MSTENSTPQAKNSTPQAKNSTVDYFAPDAPAVFPDASSGGCADAAGAISSAQDNIGKYLSKNNEQIAKIQKNFPKCIKKSKAAAAITFWGAGAAKSSSSSGCQSVAVQANLNVNMNASLNCTCNTIQNNIQNNSESKLGLKLDLNIDKAGKIVIKGNQKNTQETKVINFTTQQVQSQLVSSTKTAFNNFQKQAQESTKPKSGFFTSQEAAAQQSIQSQANAILNSAANINMSELITNIISNTVTTTDTTISLNVGVVKDLKIDLNQENFNSSVVNNISNQVMSSVLKSANVGDVLNKQESSQKSKVTELAKKSNKIGIFLTLFFVTLICYGLYAPCLPMLEQTMTPKRRQIAFWTGITFWGIVCLMTYLTKKLSFNKVFRIVVTIILSIVTAFILYVRFLGPISIYSIKLGGNYDSCQGGASQTATIPATIPDTKKQTDNQQTASSTQDNVGAGKRKKQTTVQQQQANKKQKQKQQTTVQQQQANKKQKQKKQTTVQKQQANKKQQKQTPATIRKQQKQQKQKQQQQQQQTAPGGVVGSSDNQQSGIQKKRQQGAQ